MKGILFVENKLNTLVLGTRVDVGRRFMYMAHK